MARLCALHTYHWFHKALSPFIGGIRLAVVYDVPATAFVVKAGQKLKESGKVQAPEWAADVKTGTHRQYPPTQQDWWYTRCASILRRIYIDGPVGVQRLRSLYGGKKNRGVKPDRHERAAAHHKRRAPAAREGRVRQGRQGRQGRDPPGHGVPGQDRDRDVRSGRPPGSMPRRKRRRKAFRCAGLYP